MFSKIKLLIFSLFIIIIFISCYSNTNEIEQEKPIFKKYSLVLKEIQKRKNVFYKKYEVSNSGQKKEIIKQVRSYLFKTIKNDIFPQWYGTPWDFNGTSRIPRKGKIACGYFVTNTLTDIGFKIPRIKWAQSASEVFITKLASKKDVIRFSNKPISKITSYFNTKGNGLYLVGLDSHTGFVTVQNSKINFVHANYYQRKIGVMGEDISTKNPLGDSKYRVIGKLFSDEMVINWLVSNKYR